MERPATTLSRAVGLVYGPISGAIMQRKEWKYGKYRTWLMFFYPASIVFFAMAYVNVQASPWVQWAYYFGVYIIAMLFGAYAEKAQLSLVPLMAHSQKERLELTSKRSAIATFGTVLYSLITVPLVTKLGGGDQGKGYLYVFIIYAVFGIIGYNVTAWSAKDYDLYKVAGTTEAKKVEKKEKQYPRSVYAASFFKNPPVMLLFFGDLMKATATMLYTGSIAYYFTNNIGDIGKLTIFLTVSNVLMLLGSLCAPILARKCLYNSSTSGKQAARPLLRCGRLRCTNTAKVYGASAKNLPQYSRPEDNSTVLCSCLCCLNAGDLSEKIRQTATISNTVRCRLCRTCVRRCRATTTCSLRLTQAP